VVSTVPRASVARHGARAAWRVATSRNFGPYFLGNAVSASGSWFQNLAASVLVFELTHSPFLLGVVSFCQYGPVLLLSPWAGRVADAYDRRKILLVTQPPAALLSALLAVVTWSGHATVGVVLAFSLALGTLTAFTNTAQMALVGSLVPREDLPQAVALNSVTFNVARVAGPLGAVAVIALLGTGAAFAVNSLSFVVLAVGVLLVHPAAVRRAGRTSIREGLAVLRVSPSLVASLAVVVTVSFATDPINTEGPALAHAFEKSPLWAGAILGVFGAGAVSAGVLVGARHPSPRRMARLLGLMGAGLVGLAVMPWFAAALALAAGAGFGYLGANAAATAQLQLGVDEWMRGRIMAIWSVAFLGIRPIASVIDGALAETLGVRAATVIMATPTFLLAFALLALARRDATFGLRAAE